MNFNSLIRRKNILLIPFSWLYRAGVFIYHQIYELNILKSYHPPVKTICVGNLSVGGTGKSPMVEYLLRLLTSIRSDAATDQLKTSSLDEHAIEVAVVSRGYKRKTKGFFLANKQATVDDLGDEPMQFYKKFPSVDIVVAEKRAEGIDKLYQHNPAIKVIILDDAYQHRAVTAGFNILLTEYNNLFSEDWYLPAGSLRDLKSNYKRADTIVVTKCRKDITRADQDRILKKIHPLPHQKVFFTALDYKTPYNIFNKEKLNIRDITALVLVTGIANPQPLLMYLKQYNIEIYHINYGDHHHFSENDIGDILGTYQSLHTENKIILTTEKDAVRLVMYKQLYNQPIFALPVQHHFLFGEENNFNNMILQYV